MLYILAVVLIAENLFSIEIYSLLISLTELIIALLDILRGGKMDIIVVVVIGCNIWWVLPTMRIC
jgi:hypothetical protein